MVQVRALHIIISDRNSVGCVTPIFSRHSVSHHVGSQVSSRAHTHTFRLQAWSSSRWFIYRAVPVIFSITRPCSTSARSTLARHPPAVGQSYAARQAAYDCPTASGWRAKLKPADVLHGNVQRQVWRGGPREGSGRDASVLLMLQRDCMVSMPPIRASQPSPTRALVHSQQVALTRAQDAAAELELSYDPSITQLEAAKIIVLARIARR